MAKRELGKARLNLGATTIENAITSKNPQLNEARGIVTRARHIHATPAMMVTTFVRFEMDSLFIPGAIRGASAGGK